MYNVLRLAPNATKNNGIWGPYIWIPYLRARGSWRVLDMLPAETAIAMVKFRMTLNER